MSADVGGEREALDDTIDAIIKRVQYDLTGDQIRPMRECDDTQLRVELRALLAPNAPSQQQVEAAARVEVRHDLNNLIQTHRAYAQEEQRAFAAYTESGKGASDVERAAGRCSEVADAIRALFTELRSATGGRGGERDARGAGVLSPEWLAEWEQAAEAATPGPREADGTFVLRPIGKSLNEIVADCAGEDMGCVGLDGEPLQATDRFAANANLIAIARTAVTSLIAEVRSLRSSAVGGAGRASCDDCCETPCVCDPALKWISETVRAARGGVTFGTSEHGDVVLSWTDPEYVARSATGSTAADAIASAMTTEAEGA